MAPFRLTPCVSPVWHSPACQRRPGIAETGLTRPDASPLILQVIPDLETGGAERTTVDVAAAVVARGWRALVVSEGGRLVPDLEAAGAEHVVLPVGSKNPVTILANARRLARLARERGVSVIHARSRAPAWSALLAARALGLPFVTTYHGIYKQTNAVKAWYNSVMARGDVVIANSRYTADLIAARHPFARERLKVIHRGSDLAALAPETVSDARRAAMAGQFGVEPGRPVLLQLARLTGWKGQRVVIEAMAELKRRGVPLPLAVLAGDDQGRDSYRQELMQRISAAGLGADVRLVGHCADVPAAMALSRLSVVASTEPEAFGRAAVEAQAAGVPVIVSDLGAVPETVLAPPQVSAPARTGWRVPPGDAGALADAIIEVLSLDPADLSALRTRALGHVQTHFTVEAMCRSTLEAYAGLVERVPAPRS
ncbi:glycosyltransferase [Microvirga tunisiensis]|uniref:Glycosyltransferase n=1 Tax=Pannonibacter tanglangensis TaxID=2750084 RepID=A0A7X5F6B2_9HYPH|nr:glycosyltransferase [Pannonibacter sp. XCT-53]